MIYVVRTGVRIRVFQEVTAKGVRKVAKRRSGTREEVYEPHGSGRNPLLDGRSGILFVILPKLHVLWFGPGGFKLFIKIGK